MNSNELVTKAVIAERLLRAADRYENSGDHKSAESLRSLAAQANDVYDIKDALYIESQAGFDVDMGEISDLAQDGPMPTNNS